MKEKNMFNGCNDLCNHVENGIILITDGYQVGKLFYKDKQIKAFDSCSNIVFDKDTFNFHIFPENPEIFNEVSSLVDKKRKEIIDCMRKRRDIEETESETKAMQESKKNDNKIFYHGGTGSKGRINKLSCFKSYNNDLYKFISVYYRGINYNLNFMRFFIRDNKKVECELQKIQFDRVVNKHINIGKNGKRNIFKIGYTSETIQDKHQSCVIDSKHEWGNDANDTLEEFIEFIKSVA